MAQEIINPPGTKFTFYRTVENKNVTLTLYGGSARAGFPSPASDYMIEEIDLNKEFNPHPLSTFVIKAEGDSMINACIPQNAWLLVDRSIKATNNSIVVAVINGEFTVKRLIKNSSGIRLMPANPKYQPIPITEEMDFVVWGTVTKIIIDPVKSQV